MLAPELIDRLVGFDRLRQFLGRFAAWVERMSGVEVGGRWALGLLVFMVALVLLSSPMWVGAYAALSVGADVLSGPLWLLLALISLASLVWILLTALGASASHANHAQPDSAADWGTDDDDRSFFRWSAPFARTQWQTHPSPRVPEDTTVGLGASHEGKAALGERLLWAAVLPPVLVVAAATVLALLPPFLLLWGVSQVTARLAEGLRTAAVLAGFLLFLSGLFLQFSATF